MSARGPRPAWLALWCYLIASAVTAVVAVDLAVQRTSRAWSREPAPLALAIVTPPDEPIRAEAEVFRTAPGMAAIEPGAPRERTAHPRRLATVHFLRGFPGAPPRIPHNLSPEEFRTVACKTCHERGGYTKRFTAYVPLTPHPERGICLQCHLGVDSVMGGAALGADPNIRCHMCHGRSGGPARPEAAATWATTRWPTLPARTPDGNPPPIPHDLPYRENCLTCHAGPAAVAEIRTRHPERANCRQCHTVLDPAAEAFTRPPREPAAPPGGA